MKRYKYVDLSQQLIAVYDDGDVSYLTPTEVPSDVTIEPSWTAEDETAYQLAEKMRLERRWRESEIQAVVKRLDQLRNDEVFGVKTYTGPYSAAELNAYRAALVAYGDEITLTSVPPNLEAIALALRGRP